MKLAWGQRTHKKKGWQLNLLITGAAGFIGSALLREAQFNEELPYRPNSSYSASKAGSDHLVRAWHQTYKLPTVMTNCSNNYGPRQFPEKLSPTMITHALAGKHLPVYGNGKNVRDWGHVEDHAHGVYLAPTQGEPGETYCFGGNSERTNLDVVKSICGFTWLWSLTCLLNHRYRPEQN